MHERLSRFDTQPGDIKIPSRVFYPSKPVELQSRWRVQMVASVEGEEWSIEQHVWAVSSTEAVARARAELYSGLDLAARARMPVRIVGVLQEGV